MAVVVDEQEVVTRCFAFGTSSTGSTRPRPSPTAAPMAAANVPVPVPAGAVVLTMDETGVVVTVMEEDCGKVDMEGEDGDDEEEDAPRIGNTGMVLELVEEDEVRVLNVKTGLVGVAPGLGDTESCALFGELDRLPVPAPPSLGECEEEPFCPGLRLCSDSCPLS